MENRFVGMKSRGCYETPGGTLIMFAMRELEALTLDKNTLHYKQQRALEYAEMVYNGLWFTPLREALDAFFERSSETTTGEVKLRLYKGNIEPLSRKSPYSLYSLDIASFTMGASYDQKDALGFINLIGLPIKVRALAEGRQSQMKLWGGRFETGPSEVFERFSGSLDFDRRLLDADIRGSQAFARALERVGILTAEERAQIVAAFDAIRAEVGIAGVFRRRHRRRRPHAGHPQAEGNGRRRGRQDPHRPQPQRAGFARYAPLAARGVRPRRAHCCAAVMDALLDLAGSYPDAVIPGYTHLRRAQAVLWPHYLLAYFEMFARDWERFGEARAARQRAAARLRRAGRQRFPVRPRRHRPRSRLRRHHAQQHGRFRRPRFRPRFPLRRQRHHDPPQPPGRRLDSLFQRRIRLAGTGRWRHQRLEPHAAEEKSRFARADPRQMRPRDRLADFADGHHEGPAR